MTHLNPHDAPWLHIQPLPENYQLASGNAHREGRIDCIRITTWMPDAFGVCEAEAGSSDSEEAFYEDHCSSCDYCFDEKRGEVGDSDIEDDDGNYIISCTVASQCPCYRGSLRDVAFPCAAGHDEPRWGSADIDDEFSLPPMAFAIDLYTHSLGIRGINAWVQAISQHRDTGRWLCTERWSAINVHTNDEVCWGTGNSEPQSLPEAVATYSDAPANEDLLSVYDFKHNIRQVRSSTPSYPVDGAIVGPGYDALLLATAVATPKAFLLLAASGAPITDGVIALGLTSCSHTFDDGTTVNAYLTDGLAGGRSWLVINDPQALQDQDFDGCGLLLGQIQSTTSVTPCTSPAPSSSELAAPAAC